LQGGSYNFPSTQRGEEEDLWRLTPGT
jgi:hypothetical protein